MRDQQPGKTFEAAGVLSIKRSQSVKHQAGQHTGSPGLTALPGGNNHTNGSRGWLPAAARPSSSAAPAMKASTTDARHGNHDEHRRAGCYGKRACPVRRGAAGKGPGQLAPRRRPTLPQALFGKRPTEKDPAKGTSPAVDFTLWGPGGAIPPGYPTSDCGVMLDEAKQICPGRHGGCAPLLAGRRCGRPDNGIPHPWLGRNTAHSARTPSGRGHHRRSPRPRPKPVALWLFVSWSLPLGQALLASAPEPAAARN